MNILSAVERDHSKKQTARIVKYIGADPKRFAELMDVFFTAENRTAHMAAWPMSYCVAAHPALIKPYYRKLIRQLKKKEVHPAVPRNIMRLLQFVEIPPRWQGDIMDTCFQFISDPDAAIAVKAFALGVLENLSKIYPEILPEIRTIIEARWDNESAAYRSRARRMLKLMDKSKAAKD
jgi:hypothetical protein